MNSTENGPGSDRNARDEDRGRSGGPTFGVVRRRQNRAVCRSHQPKTGSCRRAPSPPRSAYDRASGATYRSTARSDPYRRHLPRTRGRGGSRAPPLPARICTASPSSPRVRVTVDDGSTRSALATPAGAARLQPCLVCWKMSAISSMRSRSSWPTAGSIDFLASPAFFVARQNRSCRFGNFSTCGGLK